MREVAPTGWVRISALAGFLFFTLIVFQSTLRESAPSATDPGPEIASYITEHQGGLQFGAALLGLAMAAALLWLPALYGTLRRAEGSDAGLALAAFGGGVVAATGGVITALIQGTTTVRIEELDDAGVRVWWTMWLLSTGAIAVGLLVAIAVTAYVSLRHHVFAGWFGVASVMLALLSVAGAFTLGYAGAGVQVAAALAVVLDSVWILAVSVFLWRRPSLAVTAQPRAIR